MRKKDDTLRDTLLALCREIVNQEGIEAVNIRSIAKRAGVATGTVYNYFSSKDDILLALTEEYWKDALEEMDAAVSSGSFCEQLEDIFLFLRERLCQDAGARMVSLEKTEGQARMAAVQETLERSLILRMEADQAIRKDIWEPSFSQAGFVRFALTNMMALWRAENPDAPFFFALVRRILY